MLRVARTTRLTTWLFTTVNVAGFWRNESFGLNQLANVSEYTNLFDEYRIRAIKYRYVPCYDNISAGEAIGALPVQNAYQAHISIDPAGTTTPSGTYNAAALQSYLDDAQKDRIVRGGKEFSVYYRPKVLEDHNGNFSSKVIPFPWTRTSQVTQQARGHNVFIWGSNGASVVGLNFEIYVTVYLEFRGAK